MVVAVAVEAAVVEAMALMVAEVLVRIQASASGAHRINTVFVSKKPMISEVCPSGPTLSQLPS